jgi:hypothetical protein
MTDALVATVKAEVAHGGSPQGRVAAVKAEVAHGGHPQGRVAAIKAEVAHGGHPQGRVAAIKIEVAYSIKPFIPAWPTAELAPGAAGMIGGAPIASSVQYAPFILAQAGAAAGAAMVLGAGVGLTGAQTTGTAAGVATVLGSGVYTSFVGAASGSSSAAGHHACGGRLTLSRADALSEVRDASGAARS